MRLALVIVAFSLAGCETVRQKIVEVKVPVAVPCVSAIPPRPNLVTDSELRAMTDYQVPLALFRDRQQRQVYEARLEAIVTVCATLTSSPLENDHARQD